MKVSIQQNNWQRLFNLELRKILRSLELKYKPEKIILFGSTLRGDVKEWSDLDLVIIKRTNKRFYDRLSEVASLVTHKVPIDILVYTPTEFKEMVKENYFIRDEVLKKGEVIYES